MSDKDLNIALLMLRYFKYENYVKKLSTKKLLDVAVKTVWPNCRMYGVSEAVFEEMVKRLEKDIKTRGVMHKIMKDNPMEANQ